MYLIILIVWFQRTNVKAIFLEESSQDAKGVIRSCNLRKDRQYNGQKKKTKKKNSPTMAVKILHGKLNIKQDEHTKIGDQFGE